MCVGSGSALLRDAFVRGIVAVSSRSGRSCNAGLCPGGGRLLIYLKAEAATSHHRSVPHRTNAALNPINAQILEAGYVTKRLASSPVDARPRWGAEPFAGRSRQKPSPPARCWRMAQFDRRRYWFGVEYGLRSWCPFQPEAQDQRHPRLVLRSVRRSAGGLCARRVDKTLAGSTSRSTCRAPSSPLYRRRDGRPAPTLVTACSTPTAPPSRPTRPCRPRMLIMAELRPQDHHGRQPHPAKTAARPSPPTSPCP